MNDSYATAPKWKLFLWAIIDLLDDLLGAGHSLPRRVSRLDIARRDHEVAQDQLAGALRRWLEKRRG